MGTLKTNRNDINDHAKKINNTAINLKGFVEQAINEVNGDIYATVVQLPAYIRNFENIRAAASSDGFGDAAIGAVIVSRYYGSGAEWNDHAADFTAFVTALSDLKALILSNVGLFELSYNTSDNVVYGASVGAAAKAALLSHLGAVVAPWE